MFKLDGKNSKLDSVETNGTEESTMAEPINIALGPGTHILNLLCETYLLKYQFRETADTDTSILPQRYALSSSNRRNWKTQAIIVYCNTVFTLQPSV